MRHSVLFTAALAAVVLVGTPAAAQKKPSVPPAHARAGAVKGPAGVTDGPINLEHVAAAAGMNNEAGMGQLAPHIALMNQQLIEMRQATGTARKVESQVDKDKRHKDLSGHYAEFKKHWDEARALVPPDRRAAFDAAVRAEMGGGRRVGNPHSTLPPTHPKLNAQGGKAIK
ncbi:MAG TPA: hypothetical protein VF832_17795 [Longimicrobiales bacterium]